MRSVVLLFTVVLFLTSCKKDNPKSIDEVKQPEPEWVMSDSITFKIELPAEGSLLLNLEDEFYDHMVLDWENESDKDSVFTTTIPRYHKNQVNDYHYSVYDTIQKSWKRFSQDLIIDSITNTVHLKVVDRKIKFIDQKPGMDISEMENAYEDLRIKIFRWKGDDTKFINPLDSLRNHYDSVYTKQDLQLNKKMNIWEYYDKLYDVAPGLVPLDSLIKNEKLTIARSAGTTLIYKYIDNNMEEIGFALMNPSTSQESSDLESTIYENNLAIGVLQYLRIKDSKGNNLYPEARNWLKRTKFYRDNKVEIDSQIEQMDNAQFKKLLSQIEITDVELNKTTIKEIMAQNPSPYYLIDLWATWCVPCINGMKLMEEMDFPQNVEVISLSTDYEKDLAAWQKKSVELDIDLNYRMVVDGSNSKKFMQFINMESIPRYLLMDKNMNIIDPAFYQPHEPQFLPKLRDVKNHTRW